MPDSGSPFVTTSPPRRRKLIFVAITVLVIAVIAGVLAIVLWGGPPTDTGPGAADPEKVVRGHWGSHPLQRAEEHGMELWVSEDQITLRWDDESYSVPYEVLEANQERDGDVRVMIRSDIDGPQSPWHVEGVGDGTQVLDIVHPSLDAIQLVVGQQEMHLFYIDAEEKP